MYQKMKISLLVIAIGLLAANVAFAGLPTKVSQAFAALSMEPIVLEGHEGAVTTLAFSPDGYWLATGGADGKTMLWYLPEVTGDMMHRHDEMDMHDEMMEEVLTRVESEAVAAMCGDNYDDAVGTIAVMMDDDYSTVIITLTGASPNTFYTAWLGLSGNGPLAAMPATPLAASDALADLVSVAEGPGSTEVANGFMTDDYGDGQLVAELDFPIMGGAYPFDSHDSSLDAVDLEPAATPFTIRVVSHCTDNVGHGIMPGEREPWFDWVAEM